MSMKKEDYEEFQRQLELQKAQEIASKSDNSDVKTKKDEDGTEYEWDEEKKAWFPKLSVDLMMKFQSVYADGEEKGKASSSTYFDPLTKTTYTWDATQHQWKPQKLQQNYPNNYQYTDPQTGHIYIWKVSEQKWHTVQNETKTKEETENNKTENTNTQEAGISDSETASGENRNIQQNEYIYPENGAVYKWNQSKQVWQTESGDILYPSTDYNYASSQRYTDPQTGKTYTWDIMDQVWKEASNEKSKKSKTKIPGTKRGPSKADWFEMEDQKNTNVYISGLPLDITKSELSDIMTKRGGIIATNTVTNEQKLKLYLDEEGNPKGDGLCCYLKRESVPLSIQLVDGMVLRGSTIKAQEAQFELKGSYDASKKPKMLSKKEKKKIRKEKEKLLDWKLARAEETVSKTDRVVIFKKMFDVEEFEEDPVQITEVRDDLRKECEKFGPVKKVIVFDRHPDGVCSVAFKQIEAAEECQKALNGRWFACRTIEAAIWDGYTDYQVEETDREREERLKNWDKFLSGGNEEEKKEDEQSEDISTDSKD